jgi:hypothetical protein
MGTQLWGDQSGEKMDDFAALGSGTGGWYYSQARGGYLHADQRAVYQPPKTEAGYNFEFAGDVLPDYATFCLDCHTYRMGSHPPVNWGQGIQCTGNSVDPPDQRVECGAQHGLGAANKPSYWGDVGLYGNSGNPDPIFNEPGVTRGRGAGHFMRWPYDSVDRNAGINFVMSCTDCHEAHGSNIGSALRTTVNTGPGSTIWNTSCNACHYYYGGQHAGMSCGNASCHEANSVHRIIHNTESYGTYLWTEPSRPTITQEIVSVSGLEGSYDLRVRFSGGVWTSMDTTGALMAEDFLLTDVGENNPRSIAAVTHTPGSETASIRMTMALTMADSGDLIATRGISVWDAEGDPAGPWPVPISVTPGDVIFNFGEPQASATVTDDSGVLVGTVNSPAVTIPGDGMFHGDESLATYIDFNGSAEYLISPSVTGYQREVTLEARVKPDVVDLDTGDAGRNSTQHRIFERKRTWQFTIMRGDWAGDNVPERAGKARIMIKYRVPPQYRRDCGADGLGAWMKQVTSDIDLYPIVANHWYRIKVVFDSNDPHIPIQIWADDEGEVGLVEEDTENWAGFINIALPNPEDSGGCKWMSQPGDEIESESQMAHIGSPPNHNSLVLFKGLIDWIRWRGVADHSASAIPMFPSNFVRSPTLPPKLALTASIPPGDFASPADAAEPAPADRPLAPALPPTPTARVLALSARIPSTRRTRSTGRRRRRRTGTESGTPIPDPGSLRPHQRGPPTGSQDARAPTTRLIRATRRRRGDHATDRTIPR